MSNQKKRKWTVFFLIKSVDDSIDELLAMVNEIRSLEFDESFSLVLCINMVKENTRALLSGNPDDIVSKDSQKTFTTVFYNIAPEPSGKPFLNKLCCIAERPDFDITNPGHLTDFFRTEVLEKHKAKRYILFTWDHGSPFGIFAKNTDTNELLPEAAGAKLEIHNQSDPILTMEELAAAIQWAFADKKVDLLIMMNCVMQAIDTGYALKDSVRYLVASEVAMDYNGFNYPFIFQLLIDQPKISAKKLAKKVVSSFPAKSFPTLKMGIYQKSLSALFANDLSYYTLMAKLIDRLSKYLMDQLPAARADILDARRHSMIDISSQSMDLYTFLKYIEEYRLLEHDPLLASLILSVKKLVIFKSFIGKAFTDKGDSKYRPTGLAIYFPTELALVPPFPGLQQTSFYKTSRWKEFLVKCPVR